LFESGVYEEHDDHHDLLIENGWKWAIGVDEDYCGHTHAVSGRYVGNHLHPSMCVDVEVRPDIRRKTLPSCDRLYGRVEGAEPDPDFEHPDPWDIDKGDIVTEGDDPWGSHIVMAISSPDRHGEFETIEGNSTGTRADGTRGKGVVRKTCNVRDVKCVHRFTEDHFRGTL
jgi:hypothetical protein